MAARPREWDGDIAAACALQAQFASQLVLRDRFPTPLRTVAGFAVGAHADGATLRGIAVLLDADTLQVIDQKVAQVRAVMPHVPGLRSLREVPALLAALALLPHAPDLAYLDGHGIAHPRRLGIAAHFGLASGLPCIGVGRDPIVGASVTNLHDMRGAFTPLRDGRQQIGWLLRSKIAHPPLVVSPGHNVALASAPELVMRFVREYRLPEPVRLACRLALPPDDDAA